MVFSKCRSLCECKILSVKQLCKSLHFAWSAWWLLCQQDTVDYHLVTLSSAGIFLLLDLLLAFGLLDTFLEHSRGHADDPFREEDITYLNPVFPKYLAVTAAHSPMYSPDTFIHGEFPPYTWYREALMLMPSTAKRKVQSFRYKRRTFQRKSGVGSPSP